MLKPTLPPPRPCGHCGAVYTPARMGQRVCSPTCARRAVKAQRDAERAHLKKRKEALKTWAQWHGDAQKAVNAFVRTRDAGLPCISCHTPWQETFQAGHYRSRGAAKNLALDPRNIHGQCVQCNLHRHGNGIDFRLGLVELEIDNVPQSPAGYGHNGIARLDPRFFRKGASAHA